jgi:hypothetical protein
VALEVDAATFVARFGSAEREKGKRERGGPTRKTRLAATRLGRGGGPGSGQRRGSGGDGWRSVTREAGEADGWGPTTVPRF